MLECLKKRLNVLVKNVENILKIMKKTKNAMLAVLFVVWIAALPVTLRDANR